MPKSGSPVWIRTTIYRNETVTLNSDASFLARSLLVERFPIKPLKRGHECRTPATRP
jgi:hypothetical protein